MSNRLKIFLLALGLLVFQLQISAQKPSYTWTWVLNLDKSNLEDKSNGQTGSIFIIKQDGDKFR